MISLYIYTEAVYIYVRQSVVCEEGRGGGNVVLAERFVCETAWESGSQESGRF